MATRVSIREIARALGMSKTTVGYALANHPEVSPATRDLIIGTAKKLGYAPDPRVASTMRAVREAKAKDLLPLAWLSTQSEEDAWRKYKFLSPYLEGAEESAARLGYRLDPIWGFDPGTTMRGISRMIFHRGIEGVIITQSGRHFRLKCDRLAVVALEGSLLAPLVDRVMTDHFHNLLLALKMVKRAGYERIGICLEEKLDQYSSHSIRAAAQLFNSSLPKAKRVEPLFYQEELVGRNYSRDSWRKAKEELPAWMRKQKVDVIVGHSNWLVPTVEKAGYRVPDDVGVVHLATDDDVSDWAGVCSNRRTIGATAVTTVISHIQNGRFGVPVTPIHSLVRGVWRPGRTLLVPKRG